MIRIRGTVTYTDGRTATFEAGAAIQRKWEIWAMRHGYPLTPEPDKLGSFPVTTWRMYLAYCALEVAEGFDVWADTVDAVDEDDVVEVDPTPLGRTAD